MNKPLPDTLLGIVPSLNTPFDDRGTLHEPSLRRLVDHSVASGCQGLLALAVAGEQASLSFDEKSRFMAIAAEQNHRRIPLIVSVASADFGQSIELARHARRAGATGICCQAPAGLSGVALETALKSIADAGPELLMIQDLDWSGGGMAIADILRLFENLPSFRCLKIETVPAGPKYSQILDATDGRLHVSGGWAVSQFMDALQRGVHAFIPTALEPIYVAIYNRFHGGEAASARSLFHRLLPVLAFSNQHIDISIRFFKALRRAEGIFETSVCRDPVAALDPVQELECERAVNLALDLQNDLLAGDA